MKDNRQSIRQVILAAVTQDRRMKITMKKLLSLLLTLSLIFLSSCAIIPSHEDATALAGITHEPSTNHSKFILNGFEGKYSVKLNREGLGDGTIYYYAYLTSGSINVSYDLGTLFDAERFSLQVQKMKFHPPAVTYTPMMYT